LKKKFQISHIELRLYYHLNGFLILQPVFIGFCNLILFKVSTPVSSTAQLHQHCIILFLEKWINSSMQRPQ